MNTWKQSIENISLQNDAIATTPFQCFSSPQVSLLKKQCIEELGAAIIVLLTELSNLQKCSWNSKDRASAAFVGRMLMNKFWGFRFDEFIYVFRKGISGGFGKNTWAELQYSDLAEWCEKYFNSEERTHAEELNRNFSIEEAKQYQSDFISALPDGYLTEWAKKFKPKKEVKKETGIAPDKNYFDKRFADELIIKKESMGSDQLSQLLDYCKTNEFEQSEKLIWAEIEARK